VLESYKTSLCYYWQASRHGKKGLADQLRRSVVSVALNLAEGCGANGDREFRSFLKISVKSQYETVAGMKIAESLYKIDISLALIQLETVGKMLHGLINSLKSNN
jgi:four helix bundle protein